MFALRSALSSHERLREAVRELVRAGAVDRELDVDDPLGFLVHPQGARGLTDAAYRFCRYEPGVHVVLSGTGNPITWRRTWPRCPGRPCRPRT